MQNKSSKFISALVLLFLLVHFNTAIAEEQIFHPKDYNPNWTKIFTKDYSLYVEEDTKIITPDRIRVWFLVDYPKQKTENLDEKIIKYLSRVEYLEWSCDNKNYHSLAEHYYAENMGHGTVIYSRGIGKWSIEISGNDVIILSKYLCKKPLYN